MSIARYMSLQPRRQAGAARPIALARGRRLSPARRMLRSGGALRLDHDDSARAIACDFYRNSIFGLSYLILKAELADRSCVADKMKHRSDAIQTRSCYSMPSRYWLPRR